MKETLTIVTGEGINDTFEAEVEQCGTVWDLWWGIERPLYRDESGKLYAMDWGKLYALDYDPDGDAEITPHYGEIKYNN